MRSLAIIAAATALAGLSSAAAQAPAATSAPPATTAASAAASAPAPARTAELRNPAGEVVGQAEFRAGPSGVLIRVTVQNLPPGWHGMHLHETGRCEPPAFASAGAHIGSGHGASHGLIHPSGPEAGDLPSIFVGADGRGAAEVSTRRVSLSADGALPSLMDADGSSLVIHASVDDQLTQPTGGSGARIACGVVR